MSLKWEILLWILARCIFIGLPDTIVDPFPFSNDAMPLSSYGWVIVEMAFMCRLTWGWLQSEKEAPKIPAVLFIILAFDLIHFLLFANSSYWNVEIGSYRYPITNNVLTLSFWGIFAVFVGKHGIVNSIDRR